MLIALLVSASVAAIAVPVYHGQRERARQAEQEQLIRRLEQAITFARIHRDATLRQITGSGWTGGGCDRENTGDAFPGDLPASHLCWTDYQRAIDRIAAASGEDLSDLRDGDVNGAPLYIDENEGEDPANLCRRDGIGYYLGGRTPNVRRTAYLPEQYGGQYALSLRVSVRRVAMYRC